MGVLPLVLVLAAAGAHAGWNLIAKRAGGGIAFVWRCAVAGLAIYLPAALAQLVAQAGQVSLAGLAFMAGSGVLHAGYFGSLQEGYAVGDLSLVYPVARGIGPLLSVIGAIVILGEGASAPVLAGAALVILSILSLARGARRHRTAPAVAVAALTGAFTAAYTLWDAYAVTTLGQPVIVYYWGSQLVQAVVLSPPAFRRGARGAPGEGDWRSALGVGALSPAAYILVLAALTLAPVVVVAPAREVSIVFGVLIGAHALGEGHAVRRTLAAAAIVAGIALLALA
jgi:drug/metabolite transporter (DMT)-like permease